MKSLTEYLNESKKTYSYKVKIAGELRPEVLQYFKDSLAKFDLESCTEVKKTPITKNPMGFPDLENVELNVFDVVLNYPANSEQISEIGRVCGINPATMIVVDKEYDESMQAEAERVEDNTRLGTEYPEASKESKEASEKYSESFQDIVKNADTSEFEIAGGKPKAAQFNTDNPMGDNSPMTKVKRPSTEELLK